MVESHSLPSIGEDKKTKMSRLFRKPESKIRREEGASGVEFALVLPLLLFVILLIIEFGTLFNFYLRITHAAREGVRWAVLDNTSEQEVKDKAKLAAPFLQYSDITVDPPNRGIELQGLPATVSISYDVPVNIPFMSVLFGDSYVLKSTAVQRIE